MAIEDTLTGYAKEKALLEANLKLQEDLLKKQKDIVSELELELGKRKERNDLDKAYLDILVF